MKRIILRTEMLVPDSISPLLKAEGLTVTMQDGKYVTKIGGTVVSSEVKIESTRVGPFRRRHGGSRSTGKH